MSVPKKEGDIGTESTGSQTESRDEACSSEEVLCKRRKMKVDAATMTEHSEKWEKISKEDLPGMTESEQTCDIWRRRTFRTTGYYTRRCPICRQNQKYTASLSCGHSFCRQCILMYLEKQNATGKYTCPTCGLTYSTRPALIPDTSDQYSEIVYNPRQIRMSSSHTREDYLFLMRHKASLKRTIEQLGDITKAASHINRRIHIINTTGDKTHTECIYPHSVYKMREDIFSTIIDIFKPSFGRKKRIRNPFKFHRQTKHVRTVLTQGVAGIGKTTLVHKFILDWADAEANGDVDIVFMLPFWKLNLVKDFSCSLHNLLINFHSELDMLDLKKFDDFKVTVILDGVDEGRFVLDFQNNQMLCDITEASSVDTIITNIIQGNLLPFANVWITSHPSSTKQIPACYINRMTEILPFSDSQMEECVRECINDFTEASSISQQIKMSKTLCGMCHIPALCAISVSVVESEQGKTKAIQTCTELFSHFLLSKINTEPEIKSSSEQVGGEQSDRKPHSKRREVMLRFSELALRHLMKNSFTFSEKDLKDSDIDVSDASIFEIFTEINQEKSELFQKKVFRFTHVSIQEFLAALCVFYAYSTKNKGILHLLKDMCRIEPEEVSLDVLLRCVIDKVLDGTYRHEYFLRFLAGMSLESSQILLQDLLTNTCSSSAATASTCEHIKDLVKRADVSLERCLDLLHCQFEMQDPSVIKDIRNLLKSPRDFSSSHWSEITTLVQMTVGILDEFDLQKYHPSEHDRELRIFLSCSRKALLSHCGLSCDSCRVVASALQQPHCPLRELDISVNYLGDFGVCLLRSGLNSPNCKLEILRLSHCELSEGSCKFVASVLKQPYCSLRELDMSGNDLRDSGVCLLGSGLKSPNCKLESLRLSDCGLSEGSCKVVASFLWLPHCSLRELDMSGNYLGDFGVPLLGSGLISPNCKLQILRLSNCGLSQNSCVVVASFLQQPHCPLRELDMSENDLMDSRIEKLCSGLKNPNCKLEILRLSRCGLSDQSCLILNTVLKSDHCCLRELDVSHNHLEDLGVNLLTERLRDPNCKLETLNIPQTDRAELPEASNEGCQKTVLFKKQPTDKSLICSTDKSLICSTPTHAKNLLQVIHQLMTQEPLNLKKCNHDAADGKTRMREEVIGDLSLSSEDEYVSSQESDKVTVDPPDIDTSDCDDGGCGTDDNVTSRAKTECSASAEEKSESTSDISAVPEVFTPGCFPYKEWRSYRLTCSSAGLFQCRYTGLVFKMETASEVEYRTEPWNCRQLANSGYVPAGPLFDIKCPQGTLTQLRFPHCEVLSGKGHKHLSVMHISDSDESERLNPHKTTDCYVVLNISGCSKYGLTKRQPKTKYSPIHGLVLLFLQQSTLNVLLLPKNVDVSEVCEKRRRIKKPGEEVYIETTPNCKLIPDTTYCLTSNPEGEHEVTPLSAEFLDYENYTNYCPTFQVFLSKLDKVKLNLTEKGKDEYVWCSNVKFPANLTGSSLVSPLSSPYTPPGQDFFHRHKAELEKRLGLLRPILSELETRRVLNAQEREEVENKEGSLRNRTLLLMLEKKGGPAQEEFYKVLWKCDEYLMKGLERTYDYTTSPEYSSLLRSSNRTHETVAY